MELHDLRVFAAVARTLHYTRAAAAVGLSQPAVSARIAALEKDLGTRLLTRSGKGMRLTPAGEALAREAARVIECVEGARRAVDEVQGLLRGRLAIGASTTPGSYLVPRAAARFTAKYPGVALEVRVGNTLAIEEAVARGDLHLGVVGGHLSSRELVTEDICEDELIVFASATHALSRRRNLDLDAVLACPFAVREPGSATRRRFDEFLSANGRAVTVGVELGSPEAVKHAVAEGVWLGALSRFALAWEIESGRLVALKVKGLDLRRTLRVVRAKVEAPGAAASEWTRILREVAVS
jgi:DNA-binding transcriptional LysR family regulator